MIKQILSLNSDWFVPRNKNNNLIFRKFYLTFTKPLVTWTFGKPPLPLAPAMSTWFINDPNLFYQFKETSQFLEMRQNELLGKIYWKRTKAKAEKLLI